MIAERLGDTVAVAMATYSHLYPSKQDELAAELAAAAQAPAIELPLNEEH